VILIAELAVLGLCLAVLGLNLKLYTEILKERAQQERHADRERGRL
jgi:hypothetical protein